MIDGIEDDFHICDDFFDISGCEKFSIHKMNNFKQPRVTELCGKVN